ncbi:putative NIF3 family GTP cyclohydrolase 1 type 2 [Algoriphagus sp. 4150]|uniref:Nif3-like dinuclear metal center hexameric protein n=1 Tax=Algoriphagus sp. 4150 TaxID=2817756 RepID=UPI0028545E3A|nr:Nif3-like dinuclear metal center hexameric protein [Algoriphagus sp. 4150]MDR7132323.1 putative NIF3 family GTP cyclohydrolase 1 type 2 [Algoriphagus sp. 4150]
MKSNRRNFIKQSGLLAGAGLIVNPFTAFSASIKNFTVGEIMDLFIAQVPDAPLPQTVDTLKSGNKNQVVTGIVTTMFATITVIRKAIELNANFIIAHEPTFYNHLDETTWLDNDPIYEFKRKLLDEHGIAVWRNHDYIHSLKIDGVQVGVVKELGWEEYYQGNAVLNLPETTLSDLISHVKTKMNVPALRYVGDLSQKATKILLLPGAIGGRRQIELIMKEKPDVLICGESPEWETPEYVRNANEMGEKLGLIIIGHSASEEGGSEFMAEWIRKNAEGVPVFHIPSGNSLLVK